MKSNRASTSDFILAARCPSAIKPQTFGTWQIQRLPDRRRWPISRETIQAKFGFPTVTRLCKFSEATIHQEVGDTVMKDGLVELRRHLPIWRHASGRVLITGLGLGCVVRGLLLKPEVEQIDVVEIDVQIIGIVGSTITDPRVRVHRGDALTLPWGKDDRWDYAWHDIFCSKHLSLVQHHSKLVVRYWDQCQVQGFWGAGARFMRDRAPKGRMIAA